MNCQFEPAPAPCHCCGALALADKAIAEGRRHEAEIRQMTEELRARNEALAAKIGGMGLRSRERADG